MKKKILSFVLIIFCVMGMTTSAIAKTNTVGETHMDCSESMEYITVKVPESELEELEQAIGASTDYNILASNKSMSGITNPTRSGEYEPNNTRDFAYPYEWTSKIQHTNNEPLGCYGCNYVINVNETVDDIDWFSINVNTGSTYVVMLKDVYITQSRDIRIYYQETDGSWWYKSSTKVDLNQTRFHFTATKSTYYIRISANPVSGYTYDSYRNWFAVALDGTIDERTLPYNTKPSCSLK